MADDKLYLGFDLSTQQLKAVLSNDDLQIRYETSVKYDAELPEFQTDGGAHVHKDRCTVTAPVLMWVKALDLLLEKMKQDCVQFSKIVAVAGDAQQHGSVYWRRGASEKLKGLDKNKAFSEQLQDAFSIMDSPIWQDSSTDVECRMLEDLVGGPLAMAKLTGARCFRRFTAAQIAKIHRLYPEKYSETERISVISSFLATLMLGEYAPIDYGDACGTALLDINNMTYVDILLQTCAPDLASKLGQPVPSYSVLGYISPYLVERYGFSKDCRLVAFSGDNPASVAGLRFQEGEIMITLGTSDCVIPALSEPKPTIYSCQIISPVIQNSFISLICFKNSSLTRERIMKERAGSWEKFNELLVQTPRGNNGNIGFYFDIMEVTPEVVGTYRFDGNDQKVDDFEHATEIRAVLEGHFLARRMYAENCGINMATSKRIIATGGASANKAILQVMADVFSCQVYTIDVPNSACLGNCYRAKHALLGGPEKCDFFQIAPELTGLQCAATPTLGAAEVYTSMMKRYQRLERTVLEST